MRCHGGDLLLGFLRLCLCVCGGGALLFFFGFVCNRYLAK
jgi:hypothetical protein